MSRYTIIRVKEEIACHYFQKSDVLYRFLETYKYNMHIDYLKRQYSYITRPFSFEEILLRLEDVHSNAFVKKGNNVDILSDEYKIGLHIHKKHVEFCCATMRDAETLLFPVLRKMYAYLFVVCEDYINYGWVSPISNKELQQKQEQVLYSHP